MFWRSVTVLLLCLPVAARAACGLTRVATVPMRDVDRQFLVDVAMNDKPVTLRVSTGLMITMVSEAAVDRLGLRRGAGLSATIGGAGGKGTLEKVTADSFQLGTLRGKHFQLTGADISTDHKQYEGMLGMDILAAYDVDFDVVGGRMILYSTRGDCSQPTVALSGDTVTIELLTRDPSPPISRETSVTYTALAGTPRFLVSIDGRPLDATLDSARPTSGMFRDTAALLGISTHRIAAAEGEGSGSPGPVTAPFIQHVVVGDITIDNLPMGVADERSPEGKQLWLGNDFMRKVHVWLSHSSGKLILEYPPVRSPVP